MSEKMLKCLLKHEEKVEEIIRQGQKAVGVNELIEIRKELEQIREQQDLTPILERLDIIGQILADIAVKVDLSAEEEEVLAMLKTELSKK